MVVRECAGVVSLLGMITFALYCGAARRLGVALTGLLVVLAVVVAFATNALRMMATAIFVLAEWAFWIAPTGHALMGLLRCTRPRNAHHRPRRLHATHRTHRRQ